MNLLILDDQAEIVAPLTRYLEGRFGKRINVSCFFSAEACMHRIDYNSHVIVLDYNLNESELGRRTALKNYETIKKKHPQTAVTLLSSSEEIGLATTEMQRRASEYILDKGRYLYNLLVLMHRAVVRPIVRFVTLPVRRVRHYYMLGNYIMMFVVAFLSVGALSIIGYFGMDLFYH